MHPRRCRWTAVIVLLIPLATWANSGLIIQGQRGHKYDVPVVELLAQFPQAKLVAQGHWDGKYPAFDRQHQVYVQGIGAAEAQRHLGARYNVIEKDFDSWLVHAFAHVQVGGSRPRMATIPLRIPAAKLSAMLGKPATRSDILRTAFLPFDAQRVLNEGTVAPTRPAVQATVRLIRGWNATLTVRQAIEKRVQGKKGFKAGLIRRIVRRR